MVPTNAPRCGAFLFSGPALRGVFVFWTRAAGGFFFVAYLQEPTAKALKLVHARE